MVRGERGPDGLRTRETSCSSSGAGELGADQTLSGSVGEYVGPDHPQYVVFRPSLIRRLTHRTFDQGFQAFEGARGERERVARSGAAFPAEDATVFRGEV